MNQDIFEGKWKQARGAIKEQWNEITDDDLDKLKGRYDQFVGLLQDKYGHTREIAEKEINSHFEDWSNGLSNWSGDLQEKAETAKNRVETAAQENPWSLAVPALVLVALVGLWLKLAKSQ